MDDLITGVLAGNRRMIARMLTAVENESEGTAEALAALFPHTGRAIVLGVTGAPGTGKSTLVNVLAKAYRANGKTVGIVAVDPTSPFSGGAILGDRIRMRELSGDDGVFIRSMATRGSLGGLARATRDVVRVLDAAGFDVIMVETVGAGQSEVDIVRMAHTTIVVEAPGLGDDVQAIKAGILEIADILVVNKADRPGAQSAVRSLKAMLELGHPGARNQLMDRQGHLLSVITTVQDEFWVPPLIQTVATSGQGIDELIQAVDAHQDYLERTGLKSVLEQQHIQIELFDRLQQVALNRILQSFPESYLQALVQRIQARELDPHKSVSEIMESQNIIQ
jgi:LAO/AO transport system kinase